MTKDGNSNSEIDQEHHSHGTGPISAVYEGLAAHRECHKRNFSWHYYRAEHRALWGVTVTLEVVDIDFLLVLALAVLVELDVVLETLVGVGVGLVNLGVLGQLTVGLQGTGLVGGVLHDNVALLVLVITEREKDDVTLVDPDLLAHLATNVSQTLLAIEAERLETTVAQHLHDLSVLLALLLEDELTLLVVVLVLATTTVLTALFSNCQILYVICAVC